VEDEMENESRRTWEAALQLARDDLKRIDAERLETMAIISAIRRKLGSDSVAPPSTSPAPRPRHGPSSVDIAYRVLREAGQPLDTDQLLQGVRRYKPLEGKHAKPTFLRAIRVDDRFWQDEDREWRLRVWQSAGDQLFGTAEDLESPAIEEALAM
jgi:hypothetical protein